MKEYILTKAKQKSLFSETELALLDHGIDVFVQDSINALVVLILSFIFHDPVHGIVYLFSFAGLRFYAGGWHSRTKTGCFLSYQLMYIISEIFLRIKFPRQCCVIIAGVCTAYMIFSGPAEHIYNPLPSEVRKRNHRNLVRNCIVLYIVLVVFALFQNDLSQTIVIVMAYNMILMEILRNSKFGRHYEN